CGGALRTQQGKRIVFIRFGFSRDQFGEQAAFVKTQCPRGLINRFDHFDLFSGDRAELLEFARGYQYARLERADALVVRLERAIEVAPDVCKVTDEGAHSIVK